MGTTKSGESKRGQSKATPANAQRDTRGVMHEPVQSGHETIGRTAVSHDERVRMIAAAAYFHAQRRGFSPGAELDDWLSAEREIDDLLRAHGTAAN